MTFICNAKKELQITFCTAWKSVKQRVKNGAAALQVLVCVGLVRTGRGGPGLREGTLSRRKPLPTPPAAAAMTARREGSGPLSGAWETWPWGQRILCSICHLATGRAPESLVLPSSVRRARRICPRQPRPQGHVDWGSWNGAWGHSPTCASSSGLGVYLSILWARPRLLQPH